MSHPSWKDLITSCYRSTEFMALATYGDKGLWVNPVYFAGDGKFNLYFISEMNCTHMHNIQSSPVVNCAIFPTDRPAGNDVFGTYAQGTAQILTNKQEKSIADDIYYGRIYPDDSEGKQRDKDGYRINPLWHFVKITLTGLWYFDTRYFEEVRVAVPEEVWR